MTTDTSLPGIEAVARLNKGVALARDDVGRQHGVAAEARRLELIASGIQRVLNALKLGAKRNAWIIGFTHDISDTPSDWGTSASDLDLILREARKLGYEVLPVTAALERRLA